MDGAARLLENGQDNADEDDGTLVAVVSAIACAMMIFIFVCLWRLRREEKEIMRKRLIERGRTSSSSTTEMARVGDAAGCGAYDERPIEGLNESGESIAATGSEAGAAEVTAAVLPPATGDRDESRDHDK